MTKSRQPTTLQTAVRAGQVLASFSDREPELSVSRVAMLLEIPASTAYRLLASLQSAGLLEQDPNTKRYRLSWLMFILGNTVLQGVGLGGQADAAMRTLADICGETVNLGVRSSGAVIYIRKIESPEILRADTPIGSHVPLHCTALGKVLLAYLSEEERRLELGSRPLQQWTLQTVVNPQALERELAMVRARDLAIDDQEFHEGVRGMACPIRDRNCNVIAGLAIGAPASRLSEDRMHELEPHLREQANTISHSLGCPPEALKSSTQVAVDGA